MSAYYESARATIYHGDCIEVMRSLPDNSVDSIVTDPPYLLDFMGKGWDAADGIAGKPEVWREALRILKPGGHLLAFGGTRTWHRLAAAIEDAGFEVRDSIAWMYGSGFPKSLDVSKAIDRMKHDRNEIEQVVRWMEATRQRSGVTRRQVEERFGTVNIGQALFTITPGSAPRVPTLEQVDVLLDLFGLTIEDVPHDIHRLLIDKNAAKGQPGPNWFKREVTGQYETAAAAQQWINNYGQQADLTAKERKDKPATLAAQQWQGWGTALKPAFEPIVVARKPLIGTVAVNMLTHGTGGLNIDGCRIGTEVLPEMRAGQSTIGTIVRGEMVTPERAGRWPANVILDESQAAELDKQSGVQKDGTVMGRPNLANGYGGGWGAMPDVIRGYGGEGGASRFFYCPKAGKKERPNVDGVAHPTVKPLKLMEYLCRLVTPPGGTILEPFAGSGTTIEAALNEGFNVIGIEMTDEYLPLIMARIERHGEKLC